MMPRAAFLLLVALLLGPGGAVEAHAAKRVALVIGNDSYQSLPVLRKAVNDARSVAAALRDLDFQVFLGENLTRRQMNRKLADFAASISPGDHAFLFFAGHGVALGAENYLIPADMPKPGVGEEGLVRDEAYSVSDLVARVQGRGAAASIFVLDACRDNPFAASGVRSIGGTRGLTRVTAPTGVFMLFSAGIGQTALDRLSDADPDENSVFTRKLVPLLKIPGLSHVRLAKRVQEEVSALAGTVPHSQQPAYYDQIIGEIVLRPGEETAPAKAAARPPRSPAAEAWDVVKDTATESYLEAFIERFPKSFFADLARSRLKDLREPEFEVGSAADAPEADESSVVAAPDDRDPQRKVIARLTPDTGVAPPPSEADGEKTGAPVAAGSVPPLHACDRLAASPLDRDRAAPGVFALENEKAAEAVKECREALLEHPRTARFRFQLGRALVAAEAAPFEGVMALRDAADAGSTAAMIHLGQAYFHGKGVAKSDERAIEWWRKAAERGDGLASAFLAVMHAGGHGVARDETLALSMAEKAGDAATARQLAPAFVRSKWTELLKGAEDRYGRTSEALFETLVARFGLARGTAELIIAMAYPLLADAPEEVRNWTFRAARAGNTLAAVLAASEYLPAAKEDEAGTYLLLFRDASDAGDDFSKFVIAVFYAHGFGVEKNSDQAIRWIGRALESRFYARVVEAVADVLKAHVTSLSFSPDEASAALDILLAFLPELGNRPGDADLVYGLMLGVESEEAIAAVRKAAMLGNDTAHLVLAARLLDAKPARPQVADEGGSNAAAHEVKVREHLKAAAELGNILGMAGLAQVAQLGIAGPEDTPLALHWAGKLVESGILEKLLPLVEAGIANALGEALRSDAAAPAAPAPDSVVSVARLARGIVEHAFDAQSRHTAGRLLGLGRLAAGKAPDEWLQSAAEGGDPIAMLLFGLSQLQGANPTSEEAGAKNKTASAWLRKSAEQGEPFGKLALGLAYAVGAGLEPSAADALKWVSAALAGQLRSDLARLAPAAQHFFSSQGPTEARLLLSRLAPGLAEGKGDAELLIAISVTIFEKRDQTLKWLVRAAAAGNETARKAIEDDGVMAELRSAP